MKLLQRTRHPSFLNKKIEATEIRTRPTVTGLLAYTVEAALTELKTNKAELDDIQQVIVASGVVANYLEAWDLDITRESDGANVLAYHEELEPDVLWLGAQAVSGIPYGPIDVVLRGNFFVSGTTTYMNVQELNVGDNKVTLNAGASGTLILDAFWMVNRGDDPAAYLKWDELADLWELSESIIVKSTTNPAVFFTDYTNGIWFYESDPSYAFIINYQEVLKVYLDGINIPSGNVNGINIPDLDLRSPTHDQKAALDYTTNALTSGNPVADHQFVADSIAATEDPFIYSLLF